MEVSLITNGSTFSLSLSAGCLSAICKLGCLYASGLCNTAYIVHAPSPRIQLHWARYTKERDWERDIQREGETERDRDRQAEKERGR